ncbi:hypothetical protein KI387_026856, partial [Taxus chinensis]
MGVCSVTLMASSASTLSCCSSTCNSISKLLPVLLCSGKSRLVKFRQEQFGNRILHRHLHLHVNVARNTLMANVVPPRQEVFTVGDFMTKKEQLFVVKPTTLVDEALEALVDNRITGLPVVDDDWKLVGVVSDYDLLALDSIS